MDIETGQRVLLATHLAALRHNERASGMYLESMPGIGKTEGTFQYVGQLAKTINEPVGIVQFMLATISSPDVKGFMMPVKNPNSNIPDTVFSVPPWMPSNATMHVAEPGNNSSADVTWWPEGTWKGPVPTVGILFLDEWAQAEEEVKKPAAELLYKGNVGNAKLAPGWRVVAAGNRMTDRSGVGREMMFIINRRCKLSIEASVAPWLNHVNALPDHRRPHYMTISFARKNPQIVFMENVPEGYDSFCTPRSLCMMDRDLRALMSPQDEARDRLPMDPAARELARGWIGDGAAAQYFTHLRYADELPEVDDIIRNPQKAKVPKDVGAQMVAGYMLAHHMDEKNAKAFVDYTQRLQIEMQVLTFTSMSKHKNAGDVLALPSYQAWLAKNKELIVAART